tara:strand:- start:104 stop:616 length:513 start_codon:yes stop_codon:yes gene_type:complete
MLSSINNYTKKMQVDVQNTSVTSADGETKKLGEYSENVVLIVNVASYCGNTSQYEGLQKLHDLYYTKGLRILAFPCNDFGNQEPDSLSEIKNFCSTKFGVEFEIMGKVHAKGNTTEPYTTLNKFESKGDIEWNFEKFLIGKDSNVIARFKPSVQPFDDNLIAALEVALDS